MERRTKPQVFVSYAHSDKEFVVRLAQDLRRCQIDVWIDADEIRHGQPWQAAIFEDGIPTCHAFLVYITQSALDSRMVEREIDGALIAELDRAHVRFLPYVSDASLRSEMRLDLQARQVVEWNASNYASRLPEVVAEIWRGFLERRVTEATSEERSKRLAAEAEVAQAREALTSTIFSPREVTLFRDISDRLRRKVRCVVRLKHPHGLTPERESPTVHFQLLDVLCIAYASDPGTADDWRFTGAVRDAVTAARPPPQIHGKRAEYGWPRGDWEHDLVVRGTSYGLFTATQVTRSLPGAGLGMRTESQRVYSELMGRFVHWMESTGQLPTTLAIEIEEPPAAPREPV